MSRSNRPKPSLLQMSRRAVLTAAVLAAVTTATIIGAGRMTSTPSSSSAAATPTATSASAVATKQTPANVAPNTGQALFAQTQGESHSWFVLVRWQEPGAAPKELPSAEGDDADPAAQLISIEFSGGPEAANGVVFGHPGHNRPSGPYKKLASGMRFGSLVPTRMACDSARMELEAAFLETLKSPLAIVGTQPSASGKQGRQVIWKMTSGALPQFVEQPLPPRGQTH